MPYKDRKTLLEYHRNYYSLNREKIKEAERIRYHKNREARKVTSRAYYLENRERIIAKAMAYEKAHPEIRYKITSKYWYKKRIEVFETLGGSKCNHCGFSDWRGLQIDHINGHGGRHIKKGYGLKYLNDILKEENPRETYQVLCANCNFIKRHTNGENRYAYKSSQRV